MSHGRGRDPVRTAERGTDHCSLRQPLTYMCDTVRLLTEGQGAEHLLGPSLGRCLPPSLVWSVAIVVVFARSPSGGSGVAECNCRRQFVGSLSKRRSVNRTDIARSTNAMSVPHGLLKDCTHD
jgi:hypothetical protein